VPFNVQVQPGIHVHGGTAELAVKLPLFHLEQKLRQEMLRLSLQPPGGQGPAVKFLGREAGGEGQPVVLRV
jgi:hypothetical protein